MNRRFFSICTPPPENFVFRGEFHLRDFRRAPFVLYAPSLDSARLFLGETLQQMAGVILVPGERLETETLAPQLSVSFLPPELLPYLSDFAKQQLERTEYIVNIEDRNSLLLLENERMADDSRRSSDEFGRFRTSLLYEIEERRAVEQRLLENEERLRLIMASTGDAIYGVDTRGFCTFANESCLKMLGYIHEYELVGQHIHELIHHSTPEGDVLPEEECKIYRAFREGRGVTVNDEFFWRKDGSGFPVEYSSSPLVNKGDIVGAVTIWRDITERKRKEALLIESEKKFRMLFEHSADPSLLLVGKRFVDCNQAAVDILSASCKAEILNLHPSLLSPEYQPDGRNSSEKADEMIAAAINNGSYRFEWIHRRVSGETFPVEVSLTLIQDKGQAILFTVWRDITERKEAEEERSKLEQQLLHAQKLESLGVLAGGIAHDFNNILMAIIGNADLALMRINRESPATENLHRIEQAASRAADLARQMLAYSGKGKFIIEDIDLNRLLEEMLHMLEVSISKKVLLRFNLHNPLPAIEADATQIRQIIMNLVINASEAIGDENGVVAISTGSMNCDSNYLKDVWLDENLTEGLYVYVEIADSGCGMDKETLTRLFDPFFTTKFTGRGLGMSAVLGIVRGHRGAIKVYSEPGKGTSFKILLPALSGKPDKSDVSESNGLSVGWRGNGKVLLVDDEETIRETGAEMLKELGFTPVTANDGREAVEIFRSDPDFNFVILDLTMPHMDGEQCFRELKKLKPDLKIIISSGYNEQEVTERFVGRGIAGFIQKPYRLSLLKDVIMEI